ncbi:hypothetical protein [Luteolibacter soli]|uniref:PEP-CTERM sorting domain-containing protein n=1 Tax=Luteolibacter soli TaxID=3135280 RepID=A0ABU9AQ41_9BACT
MKTSRIVSSVVMAFAFISSAQAVVLWNETISGDLSGDFSAPTVLGSLAAGSYSIIGGDSSASRDIFTIVIPAGMSLVSVFNSAYAGSDGTAFFGIASGTSINSANAPASLRACSATLTSAPVRGRSGPISSTM